MSMLDSNMTNIDKNIYAAEIHPRKITGKKHMSYPGGKGGAGVYQKIINIMPPHKTYIEGFLVTQRPSIL
ncbi:hypothetical protein O4H49_20200 [Kiloniella laminariae]|uniref:Uncharacterized protein n=1 Tax=Kiloniella laminariae TaxID=454162 RepID=A0ABT4LPQ8_9PROT|nr:hypothetical protein [Kiloniella laminariae]MCZ4283118.1 hypothetical protein [Kiloniella laminariae]